jgi:hypothetical protein
VRLDRGGRNAERSERGREARSENTYTFDKMVRGRIIPTVVEAMRGSQSWECD